FSPLLPARTGIAEYTAHVLPALARLAEVTLWTDQTEWDPALENHAPVRAYRPGDVPWLEINQAQVSIYHLGNNYDFHGAIWQLSRRHPGIVVLHDLRLQHFFGAAYKLTGKHAEYLTHMIRYYGGAGQEAADRYLADCVSTEFMAQHFPLTPLAVENAL